MDNCKDDCWCKKLSGSFEVQLQRTANILLNRIENLEENDSGEHRIVNNILKRITNVEERIAYIHEGLLMIIAGRDSEINKRIKETDRQ